MKTIYVLVKSTVAVTFDETKFTPDFLASFASTFYQLDTVEEHAEHIGQLAAREVHTFSKHNQKEFVEGYGPIGDFGIVAEVTSVELDHASDPGELW